MSEHWSRFSALTSHSLGVPPWSLFFVKKLPRFRGFFPWNLVFRGTFRPIWPNFDPVWPILTCFDLFRQADLTCFHVFRPIPFHSKAPWTGHLTFCQVFLFGLTALCCAWLDIDEANPLQEVRSGWTLSGQFQKEIMNYSLLARLKSKDHIREHEVFGYVCLASDSISSESLACEPIVFGTHCLWNPCLRNPCFRNPSLAFFRIHSGSSESQSPKKLPVQYGRAENVTKFSTSTGTTFVQFSGIF